MHLHLTEAKWLATSKAAMRFGCNRDGAFALPLQINIQKGLLFRLRSINATILISFLTVFFLLLFLITFLTRLRGLLIRLWEFLLFLFPFFIFWELWVPRKLIGQRSF